MKSSSKACASAPHLRMSATHHEMWSREEERAWLEAYAATEDAEEKVRIQQLFVKQYWPGLVAQAMELGKRYHLPLYNVPGLVTEAAIKAVQTFDISLNNRFMTYAIQCLRSVCVREAKDGEFEHPDIIRVPAVTRKKARDFAESGEHVPPSWYVARALEVLGAERIVHLDQLADDERAPQVADPRVGAIEDVLLRERETTEQLFHQAFASLDPRQRDIIELRWLRGDGHETLTLEETAKELALRYGTKVSKERIRQIEDQAKRLLKQAVQKILRKRRAKLQDFLPAQSIV